NVYGARLADDHAIEQGVDDLVPPAAGVDVQRIHTGKGVEEEAAHVKVDTAPAVVFEEEIVRAAVAVDAQGAARLEDAVRAYRVDKRRNLSVFQNLEARLDAEPFAG